MSFTQATVSFGVCRGSPRAPQAGQVTLAVVAPSPAHSGGSDVDVAQLTRRLGICTIKDSDTPWSGFGRPPAHASAAAAAGPDLHALRREVQERSGSRREYFVDTQNVVTTVIQWLSKHSGGRRIAYSQLADAVAAIIRDLFASLGVLESNVNWVVSNGCNFLQEKYAHVVLENRRLRMESFVEYYFGATSEDGLITVSAPGVLGDARNSRDDRFLHPCATTTISADQFRDVSKLTPYEVVVSASGPRDDVEMGYSFVSGPLPKAEVQRREFPAKMVEEGIKAAVARWVGV